MEKKGHTSAGGQHRDQASVGERRAIGCKGTWSPEQGDKQTPSELEKMSDLLRDNGGWELLRVYAKNQRSILRQSLKRREMIAPPTMTQRATLYLRGIKELISIA